MTGRVCVNNPRLFEILRNVEYEHSKEISENLISQSQKLFSKNLENKFSKKLQNKNFKKFLNFTFITSFIFLRVLMI